MGFHGDSAGEVSACNAGDLGSVPGLGRSPGEGNSYPLQDSREQLPIPGFWPREFHELIVHGVAKSWTQLSYLFTFTFYLSTNIAHKCCAIWIHTFLVMKRKGIISVDPKQIRLPYISPGKRFIPESAENYNLGSAIM